MHDGLHLTLRNKCTSGTQMSSTSMKGSPMDMDSAYQNGTFIKDADGYMPRWQAKAQAFRAAQGLRMGQLTSDLGGEY
ncbi:MAG: hypothetical protein ABR89_10980 [Rhodobacter sp. BACL10 MAG-120910-bin24]|jgi:hypothetical protein|nr:MAG: hypothetical protein ABR89_10980 [Rhodobacter sp. BACL10 MAG-120910-bin24]